MKKFLLLASIFVGSILMCSCSAHLYPTSNLNLSETQVVLSQKNFKVVGQAEGVAASTYIIGIGGLSKKAVRGNAVASMFENANLTSSQTIVNVNVKQTILGFAPLFVRHVYTATGTIVEFTE